MMSSAQRAFSIKNNIMYYFIYDIEEICISQTSKKNLAKYCFIHDYFHIFHPVDQLLPYKNGMANIK